MRAPALIPALFLIGLAGAGSLSTTPAQTAPPQTTPAHGVLYQLGKDSIYQQGCFDPCLCPIMYSRQMRGTFILTPRGFDGLYRNYAVTHVKWVADFGASSRVLTGSGTYRVGGEFAVMHQLTLDLSTDEGPLEHFDSGLVAGGGNFPAIDITVSIHGMYCFDTALHVKAWPAMRVDVDRNGIGWEPARQASCYDVVMGDLRTLRETGGDFASATARCLGDDVPATWLSFTDDPAPGEAFWFLVRGVDGLTDDAYDSGEESQVGSRDEGIGLSAWACP